MTTDNTTIFLFNAFINLMDQAKSPDRVKDRAVPPENRPVP